MTDEMTSLARRAVACKGWRWMRGMSNDQGQTIDCVDLILGEAYCGEWDADMTALPDLEDPATLGCLLALVREAHRDPMATATRGKYTPDMVYVDLYHVSENGPCRGVAGFGSTEAEALVNALENAP